VADPPYDPFDDFNRSHEIGVVRDPYPRLAELRRACSVHKATLRGMCGLPELYLPVLCDPSQADGACGGSSCRAV
jgi:hypothetical protein